MGYVRKRGDPETKGTPVEFRIAGVDGWLRREGDMEGIDQRILNACAELSAEATGIAPTFITNDYDVVVRPLLPSERVAFNGSKTQVALKAKRDGELFDLAVAGTGLRTWARYSLREAIRILHRSHVKEGEPERTTIYVLDEPERHLHPAAQEEVARWVSERVEAGAGAIIATHALPFLDLPYTGTEYYRVFRDEQGLTRTGRLTTDPIGILDRFVGQAGLASRAQLIQLTRAVLIVEGEHDGLVIDRFFGRELRSTRIRMIRLRGAKNLSVVAFFRDLDIPLFVLLDNVDERSIRDAKALRSDSMEERRIKETLGEWPEEATKPTVLAFSPPDIICALPDQAVQRVMEQQKTGRTFNGWQPLIEEYRSLPGRERRKFKDFAASKTGLLFDSHTIRRVLAQAPSGSGQDTPIYAPLQQMLAQIK